MITLQALASELRDISIKLAEVDRYVTEGDVVMLRTRSGWEAGVVTFVRPKRTGGAEVKVTSGGKDYKWEAKTRLYDPKLLTFVREGGPNADLMKEESKAREDARDTRKDDIAEKGRKALSDLNLQPGDKVRIKYTDGIQTETVVDTNYQTGKVGIKKYRGNSNWEDQAYRQDLWFIFKKKTVRDTRWINAQFVLSVVERFEDTFKGPKGSPFKVTAQMEAGIEANGYSLDAPGYVVSNTPQGARHGGGGSGGSTAVYQDPHTGFYWREI